MVLLDLPRPFKQSSLKACVGEGSSGLDMGRRCFVSASNLASAPVHIEDEPFCRQRNHIVLGDREPMLQPDSFVAPNAILIGEVDLYDKVS